MTQTKGQDMSHIDAKAQPVTDCNQLNAKAETKGTLTDEQKVKAVYPDAWHSNGIIWKYKYPSLHSVDHDCDQRFPEDAAWTHAASKLHVDSQPQRHARINCNGKSCGEFNCDTCHPQEGELPDLIATDEDYEILNSNTGPSNVAIVIRERQLREAIAAMEHNGLLAYQRRIRAEKAEAELAALKATPKEIAGEPRFSAKVFLPDSEGILWGWYKSVEVDELITYLRAQSSPSLPLEEPEQLVTDETLAYLVKKYTGSPLDIEYLAFLELQRRRALAAIRGGTKKVVDVQNVCDTFPACD